MDFIQSIRLMLLVMILVGIGLILVRALWVPPVVDSILAYTGQATTVTYVCSGGKTIVANYYDGEALLGSPGQPPIPTGVVALRFNQGPSLTLAQTISASGVRYANPDESFVFWNKGDGALMLENGEEKSYAGCVADNR
jgi:membrane-bound inhibitor of C-type lysozyme